LQPADPNRHRTCIPFYFKTNFPASVNVPRNRFQKFLLLLVARLAPLTHSELAAPRLPSASPARGPCPHLLRPEKLLPPRHPELKTDEPPATNSRPAGPFRPVQQGPFALLWRSLPNRIVVTLKDPRSASDRGSQKTSEVRLPSSDRAPTPLPREPACRCQASLAPSSQPSESRTGLKTASQGCPFGAREAGKL
jgi:hypothetical protein